MCSLAHSVATGTLGCDFSIGRRRAALPLTAEQKEQVEDRARDEVRSVSSLVALLIVADLRRG